MTKLLKFREVAVMTQRSRARIYSAMSENQFPKPIKLGPRSVAWIESEIEAWITARVAERGE